MRTSLEEGCSLSPGPGGRGGGEYSLSPGPLVWVRSIELETSVLLTSSPPPGHVDLYGN